MAGKKRTVKKTPTAVQVEENAAVPSNPPAAVSPNLANQRSKRTRKESVNRYLITAAESAKTKTTRTKQLRSNVTTVQNIDTSSKPTRARGKRNASVTVAVSDTTEAPTTLNNSIQIHDHNSAASGSELNQPKGISSLATSATVIAIPVVRTKGAQSDAPTKNNAEEEKVTDSRPARRNNRRKLQIIDEIPASEAEIQHIDVPLQTDDANVPSTSTGATEQKTTNSDDLHHSNRKHDNQSRWALDRQQRQEKLQKILTGEKSSQSQSSNRTRQPNQQANNENQLESNEPKTSRRVARNHKTIHDPIRKNVVIHEPEESKGAQSRSRARKNVTIHASLNDNTGTVQQEPNQKDRDNVVEAPQAPAKRGRGRKNATIREPERNPSRMVEIVNADLEQAVQVEEQIPNEIADEAVPGPEEVRGRKQKNAKIREPEQSHSQTNEDKSPANVQPSENNEDVIIDLDQPKRGGGRARKNVAIQKSVENRRQARNDQTNIALNEPEPLVNGVHDENIEQALNEPRKGRGRQRVNATIQVVEKGKKRAHNGNIESEQVENEALDATENRSKRPRGAARNNATVANVAPQTKRNRVGGQNVVQNDDAETVQEPKQNQNQPIEHTNSVSSRPKRGQRNNATRTNATVQVVEKGRKRDQSNNETVDANPTRAKRARGPAQQNVAKNKSETKQNQNVAQATDQNKASTESGGLKDRVAETVQIDDTSDADESLDTSNVESISSIDMNEENRDGADNDEWFQQLCNPDYNPIADRNRRSIGELQLHTVGSRQIEITNFDAIDFEEVNGVQCGFFPSSNNARNFGLYRFLPRSKKPKSRSESTIQFMILTGRFKFKIGRRVQVIESGLVMAPPGEEYEIISDSDEVGLIQFLST